MTISRDRALSLKELAMTRTLRTNEHMHISGGIR